MSARGIRFKVWESESGGKGGPATHRFYAHLITGNSRIVWQTEAYSRPSGAFNACEKTWRGIGAAFGAAVLPTPYTADSLKPRRVS